MFRNIYLGLKIAFNSRRKKLSLCLCLLVICNVIILMILLPFVSTPIYRGKSVPLSPSALSASKTIPKIPCSAKSPYLLGELNVNISLKFNAPSFSEIARANPNVTLGGQYSPSDCKALHPRLAIVIPYRNRDLHLRALLNHLHPILQRQQLDYTIFVVEQINNETFNKALLMNAAFNESRRLGALESEQSIMENRNYECYIFHDVDLFTENDFGLYSCGQNPLHLSEYIDKFGYKPFDGFYDVLYGGVVSIRRDVFEKVNGYSNIFFGWGGEDDEMRKRFEITGITIERPDLANYRYQMVSHDRDIRNPRNWQVYAMLTETARRMGKDGLSTAKYTLVNTKHLPTHTLLQVDFTREEVYKAIFGDAARPLFVTSNVK